MKAKITNELGDILIDENVIAKYAGTTAVECFGIVGMAGVNVKDGLVKLLKKDSITRGIVVKMENKEQNKARVIFCQLGRDGKLFGSGEWDNGLQIYANNFRKKGETTVADIDYKTNEVYAFS